ncbi:MAG: hypothetical protein ACLQU1_01745 [Bryobacteraceae bacterium]
MATKKQIDANRLNSQHSTGPRSAEGKAASSQNALKSGIDAKSQVIRGEDPGALDALVAQYLLDHQPQSATERALVDILIDSEWTLRRLRKTEAQLWQYDLAAISQENTKSYNRDNPITEDQILGRAFERRQQTFARLERRRESLQRAYHRTLHDLRQIQDSRVALWAQPAQPAAAPPAPPEAPKPVAQPPATPSSQKANPKTGFVPENPSPDPSPSREMPQPAPETRPQPRKDAA